MRPRISMRGGALLATAALGLTIGGAPIIASGADHFDAPLLGSVLGPGPALDPHSAPGKNASDLADVFLFPGSDPSRTVMAITTHPGFNTGAPWVSPDFDPNVNYIFNIDRTGDAVQDLAFVVHFEPPNGGAQAYTVTRYQGRNAVTLKAGLPWASGSTAGDGTTTGRGETKVFAGTRSDPFFIDLSAFLGTFFGIGTDRLDDGTPHDFIGGFPLDVKAIVIELPDDALGATHIALGAATEALDGTLIDQEGRSAINTLFNTALVDATAGATKNAFNATVPADQPTALAGRFRANVVRTLTDINGLMAHPPAACVGHAGWSTEEAAQIADLILPDLIAYDTTTATQLPFNGRAPGDDVIDAMFNLVTNGCIPGDGVSRHLDLLSVFPYLGEPNGPLGP